MAAPLNVLIVVLDGVRADHLSCYGYGRETTPHLDRLAREGVRFTKMFSPAPWTLPAHAALLTGLHSVSHGATSEHPRLSRGHRTLPERLKAVGYRTAAFCTNPWVSPDTGLGVGFDTFVTQRYESRLAMRAVSFGRRTADRLLRRTDAGARRTNLALQQWIAAASGPFFGLVHYNETHFPVHTPPPFERLFVGKTADLERARSVNADPTVRLVRPSHVSDTDRRLLIGLYDGALRYVDQCVGELIGALRARGVWDNTLLLVTSDHGESLGEHGVVGHAFGLHDSLLRVPLLMRCPEHLPSGFTVDELAQTTDIMATVLSLANRSDEEPFPGRALVRDGRATPGPEFVVSERYRPLPSAAAEAPPAAFRAEVRMKSIRSRREKFVWCSDESNELYDLAVDPSEQHNCIESATQRADALRRQLFDWLASVDAFGGSADSAEQPLGSALESTA